MITRDISTEGVNRLRTKKDIPDNCAKQSKYILEYKGSVYTPRKFMDKYCVEFSLKAMLYYVNRGYSPAEIIVRYNSKHRPIEEPDVPYGFSDLDKESRVLPTRKVLRDKAKRDKNNRTKIERKLIL